MQIKSVLVAALAAVSLSAAAQEASQDEFKPHWTLGLQGGVGYSHGQNKKLTDVITPAAGVYLGYQFTPAFTLRGHVSGWQGKNGWHYDFERHYYKWTYASAGLDAVLDLTNLLDGYKPERFISLSAFLGAGYVHGFDNKEVLNAELYNHDQRLIPWKKNKFNAPSGRFGAILGFRLNKRVTLNLEGLVTITNDKFNSKEGKENDWQSNVFGGLAFRLGRLSAAAPLAVVPAPVAPAPAPAPVVVEEPTPAPVVVEEPKPAPVVVEEPKPAPAPKPAPKPAPAPVKAKPITRNVFFLLNSAMVRPSELVKVQEVVAYLMANPKAKVAITGYADKGTGNKTINDRLSKQRVNAVFNELVKKNIPANRIVKDAKGDTVQPFSTNDENRVVICVAE